MSFVKNDNLRIVGLQGFEPRREDVVIDNDDVAIKRIGTFAAQNLYLRVRDPLPGLPCPIEFQGRRYYDDGRPLIGVDPEPSESLHRLSEPQFIGDDGSSITGLDETNCNGLERAEALDLDGLDVSITVCLGGEQVE